MSDDEKNKQRDRVVILVGQSQNGKSILANFLVEGREHGELSYFPVGEGTQSLTAACSAVLTEFNSRTVDPQDGGAEQRAVEFHSTHVIMDTPGFGDTDGNDHAAQLHIAESINALIDAGYSVGLVVVVVRFPRVLDDRYRELLRMYKRLLGRHLENNVQVIFTDCSSARLREAATIAKVRKGLLPEAVMQQSVSVISAELGIPTARVPVSYLNAYPIEKVDIARAVAVRNLVLTKSERADSLPRITALPKVPKWIAEDEKEAAGIAASIEGFVEGLAVVDSEVAALAQEWGNARNEMRAAVLKLEAIRAWDEFFAASRDTDVQVFNQDFVVENDTWWPFSTTQSERVITCEFPVSSVEVLGSYAHVDFERGEHQVTVRGTSKMWWRNGFFNVRIFSLFSIVHADKIAQVKHDRDSVEEMVQVRREAYETLEDNIVAKSKYGAKLKRHLEDARTQLAKLQSPSMQFDEFRERCLADGSTVRPPMTATDVQTAAP